MDRDGRRIGWFPLIQLVGRASRGAAAKCARAARYKKKKDAPSVSHTVQSVFRGTAWSSSGEYHIRET